MVRCPRRSKKSLMTYLVVILGSYIVVSFVVNNKRDESHKILANQQTYILNPPPPHLRSSRTLLQRIQKKGADIVERIKIQTGLSDTWCDTVVQTNDLPEVGNACYLRNKLTCNGMPTIHSAFADMTEEQVVFVGVRFKNDSWDSEQYFCDFGDNIITTSDPIVEDGVSFGGQPQYVIIITCPIPNRVLAYLQMYQITTVSLRRSSELRYSYVNIPICASAEKKTFLSMCTMVKGMDYLIPDWLVYYLYMGVEHVYIYDNSPQKESTLSSSLKDFIDTGFLTIVPWAHSHTPWKTYLEVQIAHENDCMWRHRHDSHWMIKVDVDEFIQPMNESKPRIVNYLKDPSYTLLGALRMRNWFFARPWNASEDEKNALTVFERNTWRQPEATLENRGRDKSIARPINIHHYKIHGVKLGGETYSLDPYTDLRLVHYRTDNPRHPNFRIHQFIRDRSMVTQWQKVEKWFSKHHYNLKHPNR